jgi:hypothetical protein
LVFRALSDALEGTPLAFVDMSLTLRSPRAKEATDEIDVLVRLGDQLHLVEVKARTSIGGGGEGLGNALKKLGALRKNLGGTACRAWVVAPFLALDSGTREDWAGRAQDLGISLLTGPGAINRLVADVRERAARP